MNRDSGGKPYRVIMGRLKGEDTLTEQSFRYPKDKWTPAEAKNHCNDHDGHEFEEASGEEEGVKDMEVKVGRVLNNANFNKLKNAQSLLTEVLASASPQEDEGDKSVEGDASQTEQAEKEAQLADKEKELNEREQTLNRREESLRTSRTLLKASKTISEKLLQETK